MDSYQQLSRDVVQVLNGASKLLGNLCDASSSTSTQDAQLGPWWQKHAAIRSRHGNQRLEVAVLALTKSGEPSAVLVPEKLVEASSNTVLTISRAYKLPAQAVGLCGQGFWVRPENRDLPRSQGASGVNLQLAS